MPLLDASTTRMPAGGGAYALGALTIGVFLNDQPSHRFAIGADRRRAAPLRRMQGWVLPAGAEGVCEFDDALDVAMVSLPGVLLSDVGLAERPEDVRPIIGDLDPLLAQMAVSAQQFGAGGALYAQTMAQALAAHAAMVVAPAETRALDDARLARAVDYIRAHLADDLSLDGLAGVAAMSPSHFSRAFRAATGASPLQFVIAERLERAGALLRGSTLTIAEAAFRVGYGDVSRFTQHYKRRFGRSPGADRG